MKKKIKKHKNDEDQSNVWDQHEKRICRLEILFFILIITIIVLPMLFFIFSRDVFPSHNTNIRRTLAQEEAIISIPTLPIQQVESPQPDGIDKKDERAIDKKKQRFQQHRQNISRRSKHKQEAATSYFGEKKISSQNKNRAERKPELNLDGKISHHNFFRKNAVRNKRKRNQFKSMSQEKRVLQESPEQSYCQKLPILVSFHPTNDTFEESLLRKLEIVRSLSSTESLQNKESAQYKAACRLLYEDKVIDNFVVERYVLMVLLFSTDQDDLVSHLLEVNTCGFYNDWWRLRCNSDDNIIDIRFGNMGLTGTIPSELAHLRMLERLGLEDNQLKGKIPSELGLLDKLTDLYLEENDLTGSIPSEMGNLLNVRIMRLHINKLTGIIPYEIGKMEMLEKLYLHINKLEGSIPTELFKCSNLIDLRLHNNKLHGTIPTFIGQLENLKKLDLVNNKFTGTLPPHLGNLQKLQRLFLQDNFLSGSLPDIFGNFSLMDAMYLSNNEFSGVIPDSMWNMSDIGALWLHNNDLNGRVPMDFCDEIRHSSDFRVDDDSWLFINSKVDCPCCFKDEASCYVWPVDVTNSSLRRCPYSNIARFQYFAEYLITDEIVGISFTEDTIGLHTAEICLSPTGCYNINYFANRNAALDGDLSTLDTLDSETSNFISLGDECKSFDICGSTIDESHPRRSLLNHLKQHVQFDLNQLNQTISPKQKALCWMLTIDQLYDKYEICDGTLFQRFIAASILFQSTEFYNEENNILLNGLELKDTCDWEGYECDVNNNFIEQIELVNKRLSGTIMTEIGLLYNLKKIDLSGNRLSGTVHHSTYRDLSDLEVFNVGQNDLEGEVPFRIVSNPALKNLNISHNLFVGSLHGTVACSKNLETIDLSNNIIEGSIPEALIKCQKLSNLDLSRNGLLGKIPQEIESLINLKIVKLHQNKFSGSIPIQMFTLSTLEIFMMHANEFTGSIPTEVGLLRNLTNMTLNHNAMKGPIPSELNNLPKIRHLRLQSNDFTGVSPIIRWHENDYSFVSNCVDSLECKSCTICCNKDGQCQENLHYQRWLAWFAPVVLAIFIPFIIDGVIIFVLFMKKKNILSGIQIDAYPDLITLFNEDSVYAFIFSDDKRAWMIHIIIFLMQLMSFFAFLSAVVSREQNSFRELRLRCRGDSLECVNDYDVDGYGWFLHYGIILLFVGKDMAISFLQKFKSFENGFFNSIENFDVRMFCSGVLLQFLTLIALTCARIYTTAAGHTNTDAIEYAVILLFINDMDERALQLLLRLFPKWTTSRVKEVEEKITRRYATQDPVPTSGSNSGTNVSSNSAPKSTQGDTTNPPPISHPNTVVISIPPSLSQVDGTSVNGDSSYQVTASAGDGMRSTQKPNGGSDSSSKSSSAS